MFKRPEPKMSIIDVILKYCEGKYVVSTTTPSYVKLFLPPQEENCTNIVVYKLTEGEKVDVTSREVSENTEIEENASSLGPLEFSFYTDKCSETLTEINLFLKEEEYQVGLSFSEARNLVSHYFLNYKDDMHKGERIWVLCDSSDKETPVLLSGQRCSLGLIRTLVTCEGIYDLHDDHIQPRKMKERHLKANESLDLSNIKNEVTCSFKIYDEVNLFVQSELQSTGKREYIYVELTWKTPTFRVPEQITNTVLLAQIVPGTENSILYPLWKQFVVLYKLVNALKIAELSKCPVILPAAGNDAEEPVEVAIKELLSTKGFEGILGRPLFQGPVDQKVLKYYVKEVITCNRRNQDITELLWPLLSACQSEEELKDCIKKICFEITNNGAKPYVNAKNPCKFAKLISDYMQLSSEHMPEIPSKKCVEMLFEMGFYKLLCDYKHIFLSSEVLNLDEWEEASFSKENIFLPDKRIENLMKMAGLHSTIELLLFIEDNMDISLESIHKIALNSLSCCQNQISSFESFLKAPLLTIRCPLNIRSIRSDIPQKFSRWRLTMVSETRHVNFTNVYLLTEEKVFPHFVEDSDSVFDEDGTCKYHVTRSFSVCSKRKN